MVPEHGAGADESDGGDDAFDKPEWIGADNTRVQS